MSRAGRPELPVESVAQGRYVLERVLGVGGMATVYRAHDVRLDLPRAVKILAPELIASPSLRKRFEMEARTMAKLHHPNIVSVYDVGVENELAYMVMELMDGGSLNDRIKNVGYLLPRTALAASQPILSALVMAHGKGVIHRDIKPHNVLVTLEGVPKLTDFGIAHLIGQDKALTASNAVIGTWAFMAPEQRKSSRRVTVQTDIYAVGATLYALLTARDPFDIYNKELQRELFTGIPEPIVEVIERATRYWPEERYGSAADMLAALQRADAALRPDYLDEPSRAATLLDLAASPGTGELGRPPRVLPDGHEPRETTFDSALLDEEEPAPTLAPAQTSGERSAEPHPTLAAPTEEGPPAPELAEDPFVDEATPIHLWQAHTDPSGRRLKLGVPVQGLLDPEAPEEPSQPVKATPRMPEFKVSEQPAAPAAEAPRRAPRLALAALGVALVVGLGLWLAGGQSPQDPPAASPGRASSTGPASPAPAPPTGAEPRSESPTRAPTPAEEAPSETTPAETAPTTTPEAATSAETAPVAPALPPLPPPSPRETQRRRLSALPGY